VMQLAPRSASELGLVMQLAPRSASELGLVMVMQLAPRSASVLAWRSASVLRLVMGAQGLLVSDLGARVEPVRSQHCCSAY